jgi:NADH-quinone oxidoreductase subunit N
MTDYVLKQLQTTLPSDLLGIAPELVLCGAIVLVLLLRIGLGSRSHFGVIGLVMIALAFVVALNQTGGETPWGAKLILADPRADDGGATMPRMELFSGMLVLDDFTVWMKLFLIVFAGGVLSLCMLTGIPDREDSADFLTLLFGATVGMMLMTSSNHLLMVFLAVEMASLPSYALAGFLKGRQKSSEAALKYVVYGGGASGIMLYGISLIAGKFGTAYLPDVLHGVAGISTSVDTIVLLGMLFILIGVAFKLSAVPFHFWCPDVFEGAAAEVGAFLSVASKGAALALLARLTMPLASRAELLVPALTVLAAVTMTFGNLAAYGQTNLKRLLAYSTISHAGFMIAGLATLNQAGAEAVLFYLATYLLMNLGAFAVVAFLRNATGSEEIPDFRGLVFRAPGLVIALAVFLLSLVGLPPFAGFVAKFQIFQALFVTAQSAESMIVKRSLFALLVIGGINTVFGLFYYVRVLKVMILERPVEELEGKTPTPVRTCPLNVAYVAVLAILTIVVGSFWDPISDTTSHGVQQLPAVAQAKGDAE